MAAGASAVLAGQMDRPRRVGLLLVFVFCTRHGQGHNDRRLWLVNKARTGIPFTSGGGVKLAFPRGYQAQAMADVIHGFVRQRVAMAGTRVGLLGNPGEYLTHDLQNPFFLGECIVIHKTSRLVNDDGLYCDTTAVLQQVGGSFLYIKRGPVSPGN